MAPSRPGRCPPFEQRGNADVRELPRGRQPPAEFPSGIERNDPRAAWPAKRGNISSRRGYIWVYRFISGLALAGDLDVGLVRSGRSWANYDESWQLTKAAMRHSPTIASSSIACACGTHRSRRRPGIIGEAISSGQSIDVSQSAQASGSTSAPSCFRSWTISGSDGNPTRASFDRTAHRPRRRVSRGMNAMRRNRDIVVGSTARHGAPASADELRPSRRPRSP